jgi:hypothetical protein
MSIRTDADGFVDNFQARVLHDAWLDGSRAFWLRRAEAFEAALPRPGDFTGRATDEEREERAARIRAAAAACRARATGADGYAIGTLLDTLTDESRGLTDGQVAA